MAILQQLARSRTPLILLPPEPDEDSFAAGLALAHWSEARASRPVLAGAKVDRILPFLPRNRQIEKRVRAGEDFVLRFDLGNNPIKDVQINRDSGALEIIITPEADFIDPRNFSFAPARSHHDLLVLVGAAAFDTLEKMDSSSKLVLADVPRISLSTTDESRILCAEVARIMLDGDPAGKQSMPEKSAESLLAGIVAAGDGFRAPTIDAEIFSLSAKLMRAGGDLQNIMMNMFKKTSLDFLKFWGALLENIRILVGGKLADFALPEDASASAEDILLALERTADLLPETRVFLLRQKESSVDGQFLFCREKILSAKIIERFGAEKTSHRELFILRGQNPEEILRETELLLMEEKKIKDRKNEVSAPV
ncbi:MAG TPA: hypothetical protein ENJ77_01720 [Candidatus Moranbacteria bacterium]|nr:hypothetical protein [Candidatus Moranbacteria bacterium]